MSGEIGQAYLAETLRVFRQYKELGEKAMGQLEPAGLFQTLNDESNSIAVIVKHMDGNMRSRWTDFLTTDGEKPDRDRDSEFEPGTISRQDLLSRWNEGWNHLTIAPGETGRFNREMGMTPPPPPNASA